MFSHSKDGITVASILDTRRPVASGEYPVKIRVTYRRERKYYSTGKGLTASDWGKLPTTKSRGLLKVRESIGSSFDIVRDMVDDLAAAGAFSFDNLNTRLKKAPTDTIGTAFRARIEAFRANGTVSNMYVYETTLKGIERFNGSKTPLQDISIDWLRRYERFLLDEGKNYNTIAFHMQNIRAIINDAKRSGIIKEALYPFGRGKFEVKVGEGRKMALTLEQIGRIARYDDGSLSTAKCRDYWLFLYLCNGINMADFVKLKYSNIEDGEIYFIRQKTERTTRTRKEVRVIITEPVQRIIDTWGNPPGRDSYIFPILKGGEDTAAVRRRTSSVTSMVNVRMSKIGGKLGIGKVSTYTARHSFATVLKRSGANIAYISESLGHSDLKTTETYLASFEREEREKNAELLLKF